MRKARFFWLAAPFFLPLGASAAPFLSNFQAHACLGTTSTTTYVTGSNVTVFTTKPDLKVTMNSASPYLNVNDDGTGNACGVSPTPVSLPQISTNVAGLQGAWEFEGNLNDSSLAGNNLTAGGCVPAYVASVTSAQGQAWNVGCYAQAKNSMAYSNPFTVEAWVKYLGPPSAGTDWIIAYSCPGPGQTNQCMTASISNPDAKGYRPMLSFYGAGNVADSYNNCSNWNAPATDGKWHHLAFRYSGSLQDVFIDGVHCGTNVSTMTTTVAPTYIGGSPASHATGYLDSVRLYNQAPTDGTFALHARGNIYRVNHDVGYAATTVNTSAPSGTYCQTTSLPLLPATTWDWTISGPILMSTVTNTVEFAEEDRGETYAYQTYNVSVNQVLLSTPPAPTFTPSGTSSGTFSVPNWFCDTTQTSYTLSTNLLGQVSSPGPLSYSASGLTPNTNYTATLTAAYTDTGGSGATVVSNASPSGGGWTYADTPGAPVSVTQTGGTSVSVSLSLDPNVPSNPASTGISVEVSTDAGMDFYQYSTFQPYNVSNPRAISALPTSSKLIFRERAINGVGIVTPGGPASATTVITQPTTPSSFQGAPAVGPGLCPKTMIQWSWTPVTQGSNGGPASYIVNRASGTSANPGCNGVIPAGTTSCVEQTGAPPGSTLINALLAYDTGGAAYPTSSTTTAQAATVTSTNGPVTSSSGTALAGGILWTWTPPPYLCAPYSFAITASTGGPLAAQTVPYWTESPLAANTSAQIIIAAQDSYDPVGTPVTAPIAFSQANPPTSLAETSASSASMVLSWNANGNPSYTRYEFSTSTNGVTYAVLYPISANLTQTQVTVGGLSVGTSYYFQIRAINGSAALGGGTAFTSYLQSAFMTLSGAPALNQPVVDPLNPTTQIDWTWQDVGGVSRYDLVDANTLTVIASVYPPYATPIKVVQTLAGPNSASSVKVIAYNAQGLASASAPVTYFTNSVPPTVAGSGIVSIGTNSVTYTWGANGNPSPGTVFEVSLSTDPAFSVVVGTFSAVSTTTLVSGLFPSTQYWGRVRSYSGNGSGSGFAVFSAATTAADPSVSLATSPATVYAGGAGVVGLWHFDESTGTTALDSSGFGDSGALGCAPGPCSSTPTYVAGRVGFGTALKFSGVLGGSVQIADAPQFDNFAGSITVAAWVLPATLSLPNNAGILAKGSLGAEDWYLDVVSGRYEFGVVTSLGRRSVDSNATLALGQWTSVIGVFDAAAQQLRIYINGSLDNSAATGSASRVTNLHSISVGASQSTLGGNYDQTFNGQIDEAMVAAGAFTNSQAQSYYQSAFTSTVTLASAAGLTVALPPNAFGGAAAIFATRDPLNHPLSISPSTLAQGLTQTPTGQALVPNSLAEIVPVVNGQYFSGTLGSSATIGIPFSATGGLITGMSPPVSASKVAVYTFDPSSFRWVALPTTLDLQGGVAYAQTPHFSVFALFGATSISQTADSARVYPNPWRRQARDHFDAPTLTFDRLPQSGLIRILTLSGERVVDLSFSGSSAGSVQWDGRNSGGRDVASGVYFAYVKPDNGHSTILKFAIER